MLAERNAANAAQCGGCGWPWCPLSWARAASKGDMGRCPIPRGEHRKRKKSHAKALACAPKSRRAWVVGCGVRLEYSPTGRQTKRRKSVRVGAFPAFPDAIGAASMAST